MREKAIELLKELTEAHSVPGHEDEVRAVFARELGGCGELSTDRNGSVFCDLGGEGPRVLVAGHMDEVGFLVQGVTLDGFLVFVPVGGWWSHTLLSQRVEVKTKSGDKVMGVVASQPPHFLSAEQRAQVMPLERMFIDVGASSRDEVLRGMGISLGDPIAPVAEFTALSGKDLYLAKAFDNRVGMAAAIQAGQELAKGGHPNRLLMGGTVQEEVGVRGAQTAARFAKPDVVIVLEGPPADDTPGFNRMESQGRLGGGVQVRMFDPTAIGNPKLAELVVRTAEESGIAHQVAVRRSGGTDAKAFHVSNDGIPCVVLGVPARYIHSHNGIMNMGDQLEMVALVKALVGRLDGETVAGLTKYL